jgi:Domain of unknown function (DUF6484)
MSELELEEAPVKVARSEADRPAPRGRVAENVVESSIESGVSAQREAPQQQEPSAHMFGVRVGTLVGFTNDGRTPLAIYPGQVGSAAVSARATLDLHGAHVGRSVVLMFEDGDPHRPIILGCLVQQEGAAMEPRAGQVEVDTDGERLLVTAQEQLVLRCGKATITLTKAGKVLIQGTYVSSRSSGVNRMKGGSVQLN